MTSKIRILNVDDDDAKRYAVSRVLRAGGYEVEELSTGEEVFERALRQPALIVLDVNLPGVSGFDVCRRLKDDPRTTSIPVLHLSATFVQTRDRVEGLESGADGYLTNAVEPLELLATVKSLLRVRQAEDSARRLSQQWQATFDAISEGVCLVDVEGVVQRSNTSLCRLLNRDPEEIVGHRLTQLLPEELARVVADLSPTGITGVDFEPSEVKAGDRWYRIALNPVLTGLAMDCATCVLSDVTDRKRSEEKLALLADVSNTLSQVLEGEQTLARAVRHAVPDFADACILIRTDEEGRFGLPVVAHRRVEKEPLLVELLQSPARAHELLEGVFRSGRTECRTFASNEAYEELTTDPAFRSSLLALQPRSLLSTPVSRRGTPVGVISFLLFDDVRSFGKSDVMLAEELARRIGVALDNARLYDELKSADRRKDEFLAMLAHELRNPLAPVRHAVTLLGIPNIDAESSGQALQIMERQIEHMVRLVDDLLDVSRILRGRIELQPGPTELRSIIERALETSRPLIETHQHRLTVSLPGDPVWLHVDSIRIAQALSNLLNNASKYTPRGGEVFLTAEADSQSVRLIVRDTGVGIAPQMLPLIFDLFTQVDQSIARSEGGLGIGLTLVKNLIEMHGGTVAGFSEGLGSGSQFVIQLPRSAASAESEAVPWTPGQVRPLRILVVEDNVGAATMLSRLMTRFWNHDVRIAHDGVAAIEEALKFHPEMVVMDIGLPRMSGYEVVHELRKRPEFAQTLMVALTGYGQQEDRRLSQEAGFDEHLVKPAHVQTLERLFGHPKLRRAV